MPGMDMSGRLEALVRSLQKRHEAGRIYHPCVRAALSEIEARRAVPHRGGTIENLARAAGCSRRTLERWFSRNLGVPPSRHIRQWRIQRTLLQLVQDPFASVDQIAAEVGYADRRCLSRRWKQEVGTTPAFAASVIRQRTLVAGLEVSADEALIAIARWVDDAERERERERE